MPEKCTNHRMFQSSDSIITSLYCLRECLWAVIWILYRQHHRAQRLVIKFLLCTVRQSALYSTVHWVWTPHYSISIIRAHTPHRPYSGTQLSLSPSWPAIHTMPHYRMTWYCVVACFRRLQSSLWQDGLVLAGVIWPWPDSRPLARARGGGVTKCLVQIQLSVVSRHLNKIVLQLTIKHFRLWHQAITNAS